MLFNAYGIEPIYSVQPSTLVAKVPGGDEGNARPSGERDGLMATQPVGFGIFLGMASARLLFAQTIRKPPPL